MPAINKEQIVEALNEVIEPTSGKNVVELGMVSGIVIKDGNVGFSLEVEPSRA